MRVSVIIPLYEKVASVARALDSVLAQTYRDFEVIVVDDGSTDEGAAVVRSYNDPRVRLFSQPNSGVSVARNRGVKEAACDWVAFLDADDSWATDFLETVLALRARFPQASVCGTAYQLSSLSGCVAQSKYHGRLPTTHDGGLIDYFVGSTAPSPLHSSAVLIRKQALIEAGGFPVGIVFGEDHDTWLRLALRFPIAWSPCPKVMVYEDAANRTSGFFYLGNFPFSNSLKEYLRAKGPNAVLPVGAKAYVARRHTGLLCLKWLSGERDILHDIVHDCRHVKGYRFVCYWWLILSWIPHGLIKTLWMARRRLAGRETEWPAFRNIQRAPLPQAETIPTFCDAKNKRASKIS